MENLKKAEKERDAHSLAIRRMAESILSFLSIQVGPATEKQILKAIKGRKQIKVVALRTLLIEKKIHRSGAGKKANPFLYALKSPRKPFSWEDEDSGEEILI